MVTSKKKLQRSNLYVLIILDGWGVAGASPGNAVAEAKTPVFISLIENYPTCTLINPGVEVMPKSGLAGACEAGHYYIGTGQALADREASIKDNLGKVISEAGLKQVRIAETEKFFHVTHFFNAKQDKVANEDHVLIPSPEVKSYDLMPEMSAAQIAKQAVNFINNEAYDFYVINFANADMVAHTGEFKATVKAVETVDQALEKIINAVNAKAGTTIICSEHGNAELMIEEKAGKVNNKHTEGPLPFIIVDERYRGHSLNWPDVINNDLNLVKPQGTLLDIAPTIIALLGLSKPGSMRGRSLL